MTDENTRSSNPTQSQPNEGEGNHTAAKEYNEAATRHAHSGKVDQAAKDAEKAVEGKEGDALRRAEEIGKSHAHGEDPALKKGAKQP